MRWAGYLLAVVIGAVGVISGIATRNGTLAGAGAGWLVDCAILIGRRESAHVEGSGEPDVSFFAIFTNLKPWLWGVCVGIIIVGGLVGFLIKH
jgi:hypothetical protein